MVAEDGQEDLAPELAPVRRIPVYVEEPGVGRSRAVLQHVEPPLVVRSHAHVVRHPVEEMSHTVLVQLSPRGVAWSSAVPISGFSVLWSVMS